MAAGMFRGAANHMGVGARPSEFHNWVPGLGWVFQPEFAEGESLQEQSAAAGGNSYRPYVTQESARAAKDSGVTNYTQSQNLDRDPRWWDPKRQAQALELKWAQGADLFQDHWNAETGDFDQAGYEAHRAIYGATPNSLKNDTFASDMEGTLEHLRGTTGWNPFYSTSGQNNQREIDGLRAAGVIGDELTDYEQRTSGNAMDYLYNLFGAAEQGKNRRGALQKWESYLSDNNLNASDFYDVNMNQRLFDELGLNEFGLEFDSSYESGNGRDYFGAGGVKSGGSDAAKMLRGGGMANNKAAQMLGGGLMSGGGDAMRDVIYGKAQEKIFGE